MNKTIKKDLTLVNGKDLDQEWLNLVKDLMESNVTKEEFRGYLAKRKADLEKEST